MSDLNTQPNPTDNQVFDFLKYILTEVLEKMTNVSTTMNDVTNQTKTLTTLSSQSPTRADLSAKLDQIVKIINDEIDKKVVVALREHHKEISAASQAYFIKILDKLDEKEKEIILSCNKITENSQQLTQIDTNITIIVESIKKSNIIVSFIIKAIAIAVAAIPILWTLFNWLNSIKVVK
jgi:hypothetical protein